MAAQHDIEAVCRSLAIGFGGVAKQNRKRFIRNGLTHPGQVMSLVEMGIVDATQVKLRAIVADDCDLIQQKTQTSPLEWRHDLDEIMVAQHAEERLREDGQDA